MEGSEKHICRLRSYEQQGDPFQTGEMPALEELHVVYLNSQKDFCFLLQTEHCQE